MLQTLARCSEPAALHDHGWPTVIRVPTPNNSFLHETAAAAAAQVQEPAVEVLNSQNVTWAVDLGKGLRSSVREAIVCSMDLSMDLSTATIVYNATPLAL
jgi:hypothetical protein